MFSYCQRRSNGTGKVSFHPMKGPMTTQTLRGLDGGGAMHWRRSIEPPGTLALRSTKCDSSNFNVAFPGLLGRQDEPPA
jgi:hypothetical protein